MTEPNALDRAEQVRELATEYIHRTGMAPADFARRIGYRYTTLHGFLSGRVRNEKGDPRICQAILDYLDANPIPPPEEFTGKLHDTAAVGAIRATIGKLIARRCIAMVYAPPGSGKTDLWRALSQEYSAQSGASIFRVYCRIGITPRDLIRRVAVACASAADLSIDRTLRNLRFEFRGRRVVVNFDEAQHLSAECFEVLRELFDELGWSLCFSGSHELDRVFLKWAGTLEQLDGRVTERVYLPAPTVEEATGIIRSELPGLDAASVRKLIDACTIDIRVQKQAQRYISMRRVMETVRELQEASPSLADPAATTAQKVEAIA